MLGDASAGRDNNFNLLRAIAATAVLVSHAYPIALGTGTPEPLIDLVGKSLGTLAVMMFFGISGFLITASFERNSPVSFLVARALRILPALIVSLAAVAFVLGPIVTSLSVTAYFASPDPYLFVVRNTLLFFNVYDLPGVFEDLPYTGVVGSIWTLKHEVLCYAGVFLAGMAGIWRSEKKAVGALLCYLVAWFAYAVSGVDHWFLSGLHALSFPFAVGIAFYVWRDHLPLSLWGVVLAVCLAGITKGTTLHHPALSLAISYTTFWLAYVPAGSIRAYNRVGDYSYGIYIYAFPLQGLVVWLFGQQTPLQNMMYAFPLTLFFAVLSWHLIEQPAMRARKPVVAFLRRGRSIPEGARR